MKRSLLSTLLFLTITLSVFFIYTKRDSTIHYPTVFADKMEFSSGKEDLSGRIAWQHNRLKDPATGEIPRGIRKEELEFAKGLPTDKKHNHSKRLTWVNRGPYNVGGRTRALAIDIANEDIILAGGVSGGIWRSDNKGGTWSKITPNDEMHNATCLAQDTREGKTNTWYCGTGEASGNSADLYGNGIYKSTDNGLSWTSLESTASNTPHQFDSDWDYVWNVVTDASNSSEDVVYAAVRGTIMRSNDGGETWANTINSDRGLFTDVAITSTGIVYATISSEGLKKGIWRSEDGINWTRITPANFASTFYRIVIATNPTNENEVYFLGETPGSGQQASSHHGDEEWNSLWKYTYHSEGGVWEDLSMNLPATKTEKHDKFLSQNSYNLVIKVKPDEPNVVFVGGTNLFRSTDGFTSLDNITQIGGYRLSYNTEGWGVYKNHHPDIHNIQFLPSNPNIMFTGDDGGIHKSLNCLKDIVEWESLNNGYTTTQVYSVAIDQSSTSDIIVAGFQDNGNYFTNSSDPTSNWVIPMNGDGTFNAITENGQAYYLSTQRGNIHKYKLDENGNTLDYRRISPYLTNYLFVNPFAIDPNDNGTMYLPAGRKLLKNSTLDKIELNQNSSPLETGWLTYSDSLDDKYESISAIAASQNPANVVYYGTTFRRVFRIDDASNIDAEHIDITGSSFGGNISCITIDPNDANKVLVVISNYNLYSLYYSEDAGENWEKVAGNLEANQTGRGKGPSCRWASILPIDGQYIYFVGTSVGLYFTDNLNGLETEWKQFGAKTIGNSVVEMVLTREEDGLIVVGTHGNGVFSTNLRSIEDIVGIYDDETLSTDISLELKAYPNPATTNITISFDIDQTTNGNLTIYDNHGRLIEKIVSNKKLMSGYHHYSINTSEYISGTYHCIFENDTNKQTTSFIVQ